MVDPRSLVGQLVSGNEESEQNDASFGLYESPSDLLVKRKQSLDPQDEDYVHEEEV
jgi:hypothetical protein